MIVQLNNTTVDRLKKLKQNDRESYDTVLNRLLDESKKE